jgi:hypothetical protein
MAGVFALLLWGARATFAQQAAEQRPGSRFVTAGDFYINLDQVRAVIREMGQPGITRGVASSAINTAARFAMACCLFFGSLAR